MSRLLCFLLVLFASATAASAQPALDGYFIAKRACPATSSIRGEGEAGVVTLGVERAYRLIAENKVPATHYLIEVPDASPNRRWVERACGERVAVVTDQPAAVGERTAAPRDASPRNGSPTSTRNILAISWQPAFCEGFGGKTECRTQTAARADASRFSLHGLWPQPRGREYCGEAAALKNKDKSATRKDLPAPEISAATRARLETAMPGTASFLDRHEWTRHGSCYGADADEYFAEMIALLDAVNASPVVNLFAGRVGQEVSAEEIRAAFDQGFGKGAGERVRVSCRNDGSRRLVDELTIGLTGEIEAKPNLGALMLAARPTKAGCPGGIVDPVGLQ